MDPVWMNTQNITADTESIRNQTYPDRLEAFEAPMRMFMICLYSMTSFLAFLGNIVVIIVELFGKRSAKNLRKFLINLAISDILVGVFSVPFTYTDFMLGQWIFPFWLCPFAQFIQLVSVFVTAFTLTIISIERYFAILCPLSNQQIVQFFTSRCHILLAIGWIFGAIIGHVAMIHTDVVEFMWNNTTLYDCRGAEFEDLPGKIYNTSVFILTFGLPLFIQSFSYASIGRKLLNDKCINNKLGLRRNSGQDGDKAKIIRMLVAVVVVFGICWLPIKTFMMLLFFWPQIHEITDEYSYYLYTGGFFFCHWLAMANSFVNPIIYSFMSKSFRADFKDVFVRFHIEKLWNNSINSTKPIYQISRTNTGEASSPTERTRVQTKNIYLATNETIV